jgi:hypothetical protein
MSCTLSLNVSGERRLWINVVILGAAAIAGVAWVEVYTDWGPELSDALATKVALSVGGCALLLLLGKEYKDKLLEFARRIFGLGVVTWLIGLLVVILFSVTVSARTVEIQASGDPITIKLTWPDKAESVTVETKKRKRLVHFAWPFERLPVTASVACKKDVASSIGAYGKWPVPLDGMSPALQTILQGKASFNEIFAGAVPPLELLVDVSPMSGPQVIDIPKYLGQAVYVGDCACKKTGQARAEPECRSSTVALLKPDGSPRVKLVCGQTKPCRFETRQGRVTYQPGQRVPERLSVLARANPGDPQVWEIAMEWQK